MDPHGHPDVEDDPVKFAEAIRAFRARVPMTKDEWDDLDEAEREYSFTVAGAAQADLVTDVYEAVGRAIEDGTDFDDFKGAIGDSLEESWGGEEPGRLDTIFRNGVQGAYNAGRYEAATAPTVKAERPYWRFDAILDKDTTEDICRPIAEAHVILSADHPWWQGHYPPLHYNALAEGTPILTKDGEKPIEAVRPGELVLTHRRRWRPVAAVMGKRPDAPNVRRLFLSTGRVLSVSDEHPVLTASAAGWKFARDLKVGDVLFNHGEPMTGPREMCIRDPDDYPALRDDGLVPYEIVRLAAEAAMVLPVNLDSDEVARKGEIEHIWPNWVLEDETLISGADKAKCDRFGVCRDATHILGPRAGHLGHSLGEAGRIAEKHPPGVRSHDRIGLLAPAPVEMRGPARALSERKGKRGRFGFRPHSDAVPLAQSVQHGFAQTERPLDAANRFAAVPVAFLDQFCDRFPVVEIDWFHAAIISIADVGSQVSLWNLAVWEDETFVASGVIVHNCRSIVTTLTEEEANDEGVTSSPPLVHVMAGFGEAPSTGGRDWEPDPGDYPAAIGDELKGESTED